MGNDYSNIEIEAADLQGITIDGDPDALSTTPVEKTPEVDAEGNPVVAPPEADDSGKESLPGAIKVKAGEEEVELTPEQVAELYTERKNDSDWKKANTTRSQELADEKRKIEENAVKVKAIADKFKSAQDKLTEDDKDDITDMFGFNPFEISDTELAELTPKPVEVKADPPGISDPIQEIQRRLDAQDALADARRVQQSGKGILNRDVTDEDMAEVVQYAIDNKLLDLDLAFKAHFFDEALKVSKVKESIPTASGGSPDIRVADLVLPEGEVKTYGDAESLALASLNL